MPDSSVTATEGDTARVPERVLGRVRDALAMLRAIHEDVQRVRATIDGPMAHGGGRYEADTLRNTADRAAWARRILAEFREHAPRNGVNAEAVLAALGGEADLTPSAAALSWLEPQSPRGLGGEAILGDKSYEGAGRD